MNNEILYLCLMGMGWLFLLGWVAALLTACVVAFRSERSDHAAGNAAHLLGKSN